MQPIKEIREVEDCPTLGMTLREPEEIDELLKDINDEDEEIEDEPVYTFDERDYLVEVNKERIK